MKNTFLTFIIAFTVISCSKEEANLTNSNESQTTLPTDKVKATNLKSEITYMPEETFEEDLEVYIQAVLEANPNTVMKFNMILNENTSTYEVTNEPSTSNPYNGKRKIICRGEFGAVDKCASLCSVHGIGYRNCEFDATSTLVHSNPDIYEYGVDCPD